MGAVQEPPPIIELSEAQETMLGMLEPVARAQLTIISRNVKYSGTNPEQEAFILTISEIRGIVARAQAEGGDAVRKAKPIVARQVNLRVLDNRVYDKFKTWVVNGPDPFSVR